jgi:hypothetical protein
MKIANLPSLFTPARRGLGFAFLSLLFSLLAGGCQEAGPPADADLSTPKAAAFFYLSAIQRGDGSMARRVCIGTPEEKEWVDAIAATIDGLRKFNEALYASFGRVPSEVHVELEDRIRVLADEPVALVADAKVFEGQNDARVQPALHGFTSRSQLATYLRRDKAIWLVDIRRTYANAVPPNKLPEVNDKYVATMRFAKIFQSTARDVLARRFKTSNEAVAELALRIAAELNGK